MPVYYLLLLPYVGAYLSSIFTIYWWAISFVTYPSSSEYILYRTVDCIQPNNLNFIVLAPILAIYAIWASHVLK